MFPPRVFNVHVVMAKRIVVIFLADLGDSPGIVQSNFIVMAANIADQNIFLGYVALIERNSFRVMLPFYLFSSRVGLLVL